MNKIIAKNIILFFLFLLLLLIGVEIKITHYFEYLVITVIILQGINAIFEYILKLPINVGYAKTLYPTEENRIGRVILLSVAIALMILAIWWIIFMPL